MHSHGVPLVPRPLRKVVYGPEKTGREEGTPRRGWLREESAAAS